MHRPLLLAVLALAVVGPFVFRVPELIALGVLAVITGAGVAWETRREDGLRRRVRRLALEEQVAAEAEQSHWRQQHL
ncbi:hypothetical protein [Micromonospora sp. WMMB482]|uniref:hypothetical protein n=1 Tax=Micromonospora sp. WMMB482 TaxID=2849653 RepID=UPI0020B23784|nr:hypothetical protein [Micromonospora sp. WMMB482]